MLNQFVYNSYLILINQNINRNPKLKQIITYLYFIKMDLTIEFQTEVNTPTSLGTVVPDCFHVEGAMPRG